MELLRGFTSNKYLVKEVEMCMRVQHLHVSSGYSADGERLVCGIVPLNQAKTEVLLIQASKRNNWVLPKGGWETDEKTPEDAAKREAWEEAGITCTISRDLGFIKDRREPKEMTASAPKARYQFFEAVVDAEADDWPEKHKRGRKWMSFAEAQTVLKARPELLDALDRSSLKR